MQRPGDPTRADPGDRTEFEGNLTEASIPEVGQELALAQEHLRGMHLEPRPDCWRCGSASLSADEPR